MIGFTPLPAAVIAAVLAVVAALYLLKPPARRVLVPSNLIWDQVLRRFRRRDDRLRWWLSLLLAGLIAGLLAYSVLHSHWTASASASNRLVIVVDNAPTMAARMSDGGTRFEHARRRARELISSLGAGQHVLLADTMRRIALPAFEPAQAALARLDRLSVGVGREPAIPSAAQLAPAEAVYVLTDGVLLREFPSRAQIDSVFESVENVGISRLELSAVPADDLRHQAFIEVENAGGVAKSVELSLHGPRGQSIVRQLRLPAFGSVAQSLDVSDFGGGALRVALTAPGDALSLDDVAYAYLPDRRPLRLTLVSDSNPYLEKALSVQPRVRLSVVKPAEYADRGEADLYVFDRNAPATAPSVPALLIRPGPARWLPPVGAEINEPQVARWDPAHPLLQGLSLRELRVDRALPPAAQAADAAVLVRARGGQPLLIAREAMPRRILLAFSLDQSNFALHAGFPVFLGTALNWLTSEPAVANARLGEVELPLRSARVIAMDGSDVVAHGAGAATRFEANEPGIYTAQSGRSRISAAINALDSRLTQVNRSVLVSAEQHQQELRAVSTDPWFALMLSAVLLLVFEWVGYNRRFTV